MSSEFRSGVFAGNQPHSASKGSLKIRPLLALRAGSRCEQPLTPPDGWAILQIMRNIVACVLISISARSTIAAPVDYEREVKPIFREHCSACHGVLKQKVGFGSIPGTSPNGRRFRTGGYPRQARREPAAQSRLRPRRFSDAAGRRRIQALRGENRPDHPLDCRGSQLPRR